MFTKGAASTATAISFCWRAKSASLSMGENAGTLSPPTRMGGKTAISNCQRPAFFWNKNGEI